jgi:hypothetical protein
VRPRVQAPVLQQQEEAKKTNKTLPTMKKKDFKVEQLT